jgi:hypothetical protein
MYLWRFAIEHMFRFAKQHLGLNANQSTDLVSTQHWMWLCALAYWQLLLMRDEVKASRPAWYPAGMKPETKGLTPGFVIFLPHYRPELVPVHSTRSAEER